MKIIKNPEISLLVKTNKKKQKMAEFMLCFFIVLLFKGHPAVNLKSKETVSCCAILVGGIKIRAHHVADLKLSGTS